MSTPTGGSWNDNQEQDQQDATQTGQPAQPQYGGQGGYSAPQGQSLGQGYSQNYNQPYDQDPATTQAAQAADSDQTGQSGQGAQSGQGSPSGQGTQGSPSGQGGQGYENQGYAAPVSYSPGQGYQQPAGHDPGYQQGQGYSQGQGFDGGYTQAQPQGQQGQAQHQGQGQGGFGQQAQQVGQQFASDAGQIATGAGEGVGALFSDLQFRKSLTERIASLIFLGTIVWAALNFISDLTYYFGSQDFGGGVHVRHMSIGAGIVNTITSFVLLLLTIGAVRLVLELAINVARIAQRGRDKDAL